MPLCGYAVAADKQKGPPAVFQRWKELRETLEPRKGGHLLRGRDLVFGIWQSVLYIGPGKVETLVFAERAHL